MDELEDRFTVDEKRIYLVGFSNGGQMAFRCAVEMSDVLAAVIESGGTVAGDTTVIPKRNIPVAFQVGNEDDRYFSSPAPLSQFEDGLSQIDFFRRVAHSHTSTFQYSTEYTLTGDTARAVIATYPPLTPGENRVFSMVLIKDLGHNYPNGQNHWMKGAEQNWAWLKQFTVP